MTIREVIKMLKDDGWVECAQRGSHIQFKHETKKGKVTIPNHGGDIPRGTLNSILKQAGLR